LIERNRRLRKAPKPNWEAWICHRHLGKDECLGTGSVTF
jgi:hypothetical protein